MELILKRGHSKTASCFWRTFSGSSPITVFSRGNLVSRFERGISRGIKRSPASIFLHLQVIGEQRSGGLSMRLKIIEALPRIPPFPPPV